MGSTDVETMTNVTIGKYDFDDEAFQKVSKESLDFISKLLVKDLRWEFYAYEMILRFFPIKSKWWWYANHLCIYVCPCDRNFWSVTITIYNFNDICFLFLVLFFSSHHIDKNKQHTNDSWPVFGTSMVETISRATSDHRSSNSTWIWNKWHRNSTINSSWGMLHVIGVL